MANVNVGSIAEAINAGNRVVVRTSANRVYVLTKSSSTVMAMNKGNQDGEPTSFSAIDEITGLTGLQSGGGACAIDSNDIIHCIYYQADTAMAGIKALRYVTFDTSTDTFGTPEDVATLDNDGVSYFTCGIAIDANDNPHVVWHDALTSMGSTTETAWYSNKTSGSWRTRVSIENNTDGSRYYLDIIIGEPTSTIGSDRPIVIVRDAFGTSPYLLNAYHGTALDASGFTAQTDITGSIDPRIGHISAAIDSNGKITVAFIENISNDLMVVEHLASSAWSSWETPVDVDTSTDYTVPSIAIIGTDRYIFVEDSTNSDLNLWKHENNSVSYYFDGSDTTIDNGNADSNPSNYYDGNDTTYGSGAAIGQSHGYEIHGTNAPASGDPIESVDVEIITEPNGFTSGVAIRVYTDGQGETLLSTTKTVNSSDPKEGTTYTLSTPSGGWTWAKIQALEFEHWYTTGSPSTNRVYQMNVVVHTGWVEETADTDLPNVGTFDNVKVKWASYWNKIEKYRVDGNDAITDTNNVWTNESNAFDSNDATFATTTTNGPTFTLIGEGTNSPITGNSIGAVKVIVTGRSRSLTSSLRTEIRLDGQGELLATIDIQSITSGTKASAILSEPTGGWTWEKINLLESKTWSTGGTNNQAELALIEVIVSTDSNDLDYAFEDSSGNVLYNTIQIAGVTTNSKDVTFDAILKKEAITKDVTFDSALQKTELFKDVTFDARLDPPVVTNNKDVTFDAALQKTGLNKDVTFDSILKKTEITQDVTFDSVLKKTELFQDVTFDAVLAKQFNKDVTFDSILKKTEEFKDVTFDSVLSKQFNKDLTFDSILQKTELFKDVTFDASLIKQNNKDVTFDAILKKAELTQDVTFDSILQKVGLFKDVTFDSVLVKQNTKDVNFDAILMKVGQKDVTFDSVLKKNEVFKDVTFDAVLRVLGIDKETTFDAVLQKVELFKDITFDSILQKIEQQKDVNFDSILMKVGQKDVTGDAILKKNEVFKDVTFDAVLTGGVETFDVTFDAVLKKLGVFKDTTFDSALQKTELFKDVTFDAVLANRFNKDVTFDSALQKVELNKDVTFDAVLQVLGIQNETTFDAVLKKLGLSQDVTFDTILTKIEQQKDVTFDSILQKAGLFKDVTFDSHLIKRFNKDVTFDSILKGLGIFKDVTFDAHLILPTQQFDTTFDAVLQKQGLSKDVTFDAHLFKERPPTPLKGFKTVGVREPAYYTTKLIVTGDTVDLKRVKVSGITQLNTKLHVIGDTILSLKTKVDGITTLKTLIKTEALTTMIHEMKIEGTTLYTKKEKLVGITLRAKRATDLLRENFHILFDE
ncbi:MAG: hypothetical protein ACE5Q4_02745 [Nitrosopumilus sp.]